MKAVKYTVTVKEKSYSSLNVHFLYLKGPKCYVNFSFGCSLKLLLLN